MTPVRPRFANPPLIERAISVAFNPLSQLSLGDYGLFWAEIRSEFPVSEAMEPLPLEVEQFNQFQPRQVGIQMLPAGALPRAAFRNSEEGELIQLQPDRFGFNWIKTTDRHAYPHSEATMQRFFELLDRFAKFSSRRGYPDLKYLQCEITNVNVIPVSDIGQSFSDISTVLRVPSLDASWPNISLEYQLIGSKHLILSDSGDPIGRVHVLGQPSVKLPSNEEAYRFDISARGAPIGSGVAGVSRFLEIAASAVNAAFLANVTKTGRRFWGEMDA